MSTGSHRAHIRAWLRWWPCGSWSWRTGSRWRLKRGLEEDGYAVDVAPTGPHAVWQVSEFGYDTVLLDLMLPH